MPSRTKLDADINLEGERNPTVQAEIDRVFVQIGEQFPKLLEKLSEQDPDKYLRSDEGVLAASSDRKSQEVPTSAQRGGVPE